MDTHKSSAEEESLQIWEHAEGKFTHFTVVLGRGVNADYSCRFPAKWHFLLKDVK